MIRLTYLLRRQPGLSRSNSPLWFNYEYPQVNPSPENIVATEFSSLIKSYFAIRQLPYLSLEQAQLYWRTCHAFLLRKIAAAGHIRRYLQVHRYEDDIELEMRNARGTLIEPYIGHAESGHMAVALPLVFLARFYERGRSASEFLADIL